MKKIILFFLILIQVTEANEYNCQIMTKVNEKGEFTSNPVRADTKVSVQKKSITMIVDGYAYTSSFSEAIQKGMNAYKTGPNLMIHYTNNNTFLFKNGTMAFAITHCK